jgi:hypothetical protein
MPPWLLTIVAVLRVPFVWVAGELNVGNQLRERRLAAERLRDPCYRIADYWTELTGLFRDGWTVDHVPASELIQRMTDNLLYLQREGLDEVLTRCRTSTHPAAQDVAGAATEVQQALTDLVDDAPRSGGSPYVRTTIPIADTLIEAVRTAVDQLADANSAFVWSARKDLR